jgi:protein-tyrosine phosphatase
MACERLQLAQRDDPALVASVAARILRGELCVLPTETVYGLAVRPGDERAVSAVRALKGRNQEHVFTWHLADAGDLQRLGRADDVRVQRLVQRYWPGPLTVVVPGRTGGTIGARVPAHEFTRAVIRKVGEPLWLTSVNRSGEAPLTDAAAIVAAFGSELAVVVDDGPSPLGVASTVVRCTGAQLDVLREGILSRDEVLRAAAAKVLFVCTGNTCRSPLAEAIARRDAAKALGVAADAVLAHGLAFASAGTGTLLGMPASDGSVVAAAEIGIDLSAHQSQPLSDSLARGASRIYALSESHLRAIEEQVPEAAAKAVLLHPEGLGIADPFGGEIAAYRRARDEIAVAVQARLHEWLQLLPK